MKCDGCEPGWCERHQVHKPAGLVHLCQTNERYFRAWEEGRGPGQRSSKQRLPVARKLPDPVCIHRGDKIGTADCGCAGKPVVYQCGVHGFAMDRKLKPGRVPIVTGEGKQHCDVAYCNVCDDFATKQYPPILTRNLIYHIYPAGDWQESLNEIAAHIDVFNGRRIVAIATDTDMDVDAIWDEVMVALRPHVLFTAPNDPKLRETVTFMPLIESVLNESPSEATFYCHTKGNTTADGKTGARRWRQVMVDRLLGHFDDAMRHLGRYAFVGTHKMIWPDSALPPYPTRLRARHQWMHSGTFWWFRHDRVAELHTPEAIAWDRYGVEAWPSQLVPHTEAYSMWQPWIEDAAAYPQRSPYDAGLYDRDYSR
jgi:hypothetical protein